MKIKKEELLIDLQNDVHFISKSGSWKYTGSLGTGMESKFARKSYSIWSAQGDRCNSIACRSFVTYGGKGVKRIWGSREFISWYTNALLTKDYWEFPNVSRFKDTGNYNISNCEVIEMHENLSSCKGRKRNTGKEFIKQKLLTLINGGANFEDLVVFINNI